MDALTRRQFDRAMFAKDRTLAIRVGDYASRDIKEASFEYGYIKGDTYKPGGTCAGSGKITFTSIITTFNKLDILHPEIGLLVGDTYQWVKMGEYFINDIEIDRNRNTTTLELMDGMFKLNREYVTDLHFPAEVREVIQEICLKTDIELANDYFGISAMRYHIEQVPEGKKLSFRDMLSSMTQMIGMSCFFNREGKMEIRDLTESNITINADSYFLHGLTKSEIEYQIAGITCKTDKKPLTVGMKTGRSLELDNVFMTQSALNDLYYKLKNLTYYPYNLNYQGHLLLEVGQWVTIQTNKKETFKVPVLSQSFTFKGGLRGRISADSKAGNDTQYSYEGTITKQIKQQDGIEAKIQAQIEAADKDFDQKVDKIKKDFNDQVELAKAKAEEVKQELSDTINQRFDSFNNGPLQEAKRRVEEALRNAGASTLLAKEAKLIGLDSIDKLEEFKRQATSAQVALSGDLDALKRTVTSEVNQASEYRRTTTEALSRMTGQMNGFATKSEVKQGIDGLTQTFAKMKVGGRNYAEDYDFSRGLWIYSQGDSSPVGWKIINGEYNVKGTTNTWKQMQIYSKEGSRASSKSSTALLDLEIGETYTLSFQGICYSGSPNVWVSLRANRTAPGNPEIMNGNFTLTSSWQTYQVTIPALTKPDNFDFWRIILGYNKIGHVAFRKVELTRSSTRIDAGPAPEDGKTDLVVAKSEFQKTADGLSAKLATVENYVGQDGQRQEALRRYTREESAKQATAVRELVAKDYVGKATYQEDVKGINQKIEAVKTSANKEIASQIASYRQSVDGKFTDISSQITTYKQDLGGQISGLSNRLTSSEQGNTTQISNLKTQVATNKDNADSQFKNVTNQLARKVETTDFQRVKETSQLYERILGNTENGIADKVARMALTNQLFQVEVSKYSSQGGPNLIKNSGNPQDIKDWGYWEIGQTPKLNVVSHSFFYNEKRKLFSFPNDTKIGVPASTIRFSLKRNTNYTVALTAFNTWNMKGATIFFLGRKTGENQAFTKVITLVENVKFSSDEAVRKNYTFNSGECDEGFIRIDNNGTNNSDVAILLFGDVDVYEGTVTRPWQPSPEDTEEAIRTVQTQLAGSWSVQNINSAGDIISGINLGANGHNRFVGKLTHITGETLIDNAVIKSAMVDKLKTANFEAGSVTTTILDAEAVTAEKVRFDDAFIRKMIANEAFINQLTSKRIFATKVESVISSSTVLEGYKGWIGGFQLGTHDSGSGRWITGRNHFSVGMGDGTGGDGRTALWVNWGHNWNEAGYYAWFVKNNGKMCCYNTAEFWKTPIIHGDLKVTGNIIYDGGTWLYSRKYSHIESSGGSLYLYHSSGYDWIIMNKDVSDRRYKTNVKDSAISGLDIINNLKTYSYRKEYDGKTTDISCGIMAQDVQKYAPEAFFENPDGAYSYRTFELVPYLIKAIQELNQKIEKMEKTIA